MAAFHCPACGVKGTIKDELIGRKALCPKCKIRLRILGDGKSMVLPPKPANAPPSSDQTAGPLRITQETPPPPRLISGGSR